MTVEYVLLLSLFVFLVMGALTSTPQNTFEKAGPRLGARVEKHLSTGDGFGTSRGGSRTQPLEWK
jgi:hypothetical protein